MKVLLVSYSPLSMSSNGGKYFISRFLLFERDELCQLYVNKRMPEYDKCNSFFQLNEADLMKHKDGMIRSGVKDDKCVDVDNNESVLYRNADKFRSLKLLVRDFIWKATNYGGYTIDSWIKDEKPDIIFSDTGDSSFLYELSMRLSKKYNIPLVGDFSDNYHAETTVVKNPLVCVQRLKLKKTIEKFVNRCDAIITLNESFTRYFKSTFTTINGDKFNTIYMGANPQITTIKNCTAVDNSQLVITYIGNISLGRDQCLLEIGKNLKTINDEFNTKHKLNLFGNFNEQFKLACGEIDSISIMGFIPGKEVANAIEKSNVLVFVESFRDEFIEKTRYSLSSKIPDYLVSGKCVFAYGPKGIASIDHLIQAGCIVATSKDEMSNKMIRLLQDSKMRHISALQSKRFGDMMHDARENSMHVKMILEGCIRGKHI